MYRNFRNSSNSYNSNGRRFNNNNPGRSRFRRGGSTLDVTRFVQKAQQSDSIETDTAPNTHESFMDFDICAPLKENILARGFDVPTPIQDQAIDSILAGRDLIGLAGTGTGKTAAFLIPIINKIFKDRNQNALIIAPTRELAQQIDDELRNFSRGMKMYSAVVIGGSNMYRQINDIRRNPHFVIGTPGRIKDLIERKVLYLEDFQTIVLDEVDLMVDIGFINDIKYFISLLPKERQSLFFSATISPKIESILQNFVNNPVTVSIKKQTASENIDQDVIKVISRDKKVEQLHDLLIQEGFDKVLIFGRTKHEVDRLNKELVYRGFKADAIHGNKTQGQRQRILNSFKRNEIQILLATDVASRGLDIDNVTHVINYDIPETYEDYTHRIGRTGRANKKGVALTFID